MNFSFSIFNIEMLMIFNIEMLIIFNIELLIKAIKNILLLISKSACFFVFNFFYWRLLNNPIKTYLKN